MYVRRTFDYRINIYNKVIEFVSNKEENCRNELVKIFVGKCYDGCFIVSIENINMMSGVEIYQQNEDGTGIMNVNFTVIAYKVELGDLIPNCKVEKKEPNHIYLSTIINQNHELGNDVDNQLDNGKFNTAKLMCINRDIYNSIKEGQLVIFEVFSSSYQLFSDFVAINGRIFVSHKDEPIAGYTKTFKIYDTKFTDYEVGLVQHMLDNKLNLITNNSDNNKYSGMVDYFKQLLLDKTNYNIDKSNSHKSGKKTTSDNIKLIDNINHIDEIIKLIDKNNIIQLNRTSFDSLSVININSNLSVSELKDNETDLTFIEYRLFDAICMIINQYNNLVNVINELAITFSNKTLFEKHNNIWLIIKNQM